MPNTIRRMTGATADRFMLRERGYLKEGYYADLTVFDEEEIREAEPELYERRGRDRFNFKTGNGSENFYDMQYRAVAALREILAEDFARNIVIVAHSGVIRALENNLKGLRVDDDWQPLEKGGIRIWQEAEKAD